MTIAFDREAGTIGTFGSLEDLPVEQDSIEILFDIAISTEFTFLDEIEKIDRADYYVELPATISEAVAVHAENETVAGYLPGSHKVGWIGFDIAAGTYDFLFTQSGSSIPWSVTLCDELVTSCASTPFYGTSLSAGTYFVRVESSSVATTFKVALVKRS
ncbi:MAG: hypothetical protein MZU97_11480 [Bacillus subtilis]|nr:hypothetical protein [Bacillus subtilis]